MEKFSTFLFKFKTLFDKLTFLMVQFHVTGVEASVPKLYDKLFSHLVEPELTSPTFVLHHPMCMSPLAKRHRDQPHLAERFELFVSGMELINAYTELNNPAEQRRFQEKVKQLVGKGPVPYSNYMQIILREQGTIQQ